MVIMDVERDGHGIFQDTPLHLHGETEKQQKFPVTIASNLPKIQIGYLILPKQYYSVWW
jgi:hypothetical protein